MNLNVNSAIGHDSQMSERVKKLLAEARAWCSQERGRQSQLAAFLGVSRQRISLWFSEYEKEDPKTQPTGEQVLTLQEFLKQQKKS